MSHRKSVPFAGIAPYLLAMFMILPLISFSAAAEEATVMARVTVIIDIYGYGPVEFTGISGPCGLWYSPPYPDPDGYITIDTEILELELMDGGITIGKNSGLPSPGRVRGPEPGIDFPAESFFDVFFEIEIPGHFPGDTLSNLLPLHVTGLIDQYPPYFENYIYPEGSPPIALFDRSGIEVGALLYLSEEILPWYEPGARIWCPASYRSEVAIINDDGLVELPAALPGIADEDIDFAKFGYRPLGDPGMFVPFYTDFSGAGTRASTHGPAGEGDGWCGYFDPGSEPFEGQVVEFEVTFFPRRPGPLFQDTCSIWIDRTPPIPWILPDDTMGDPETLRLYQVDSFFDIMFTVPDEMPGPGPAELQVFPLSQRFERILTAVDQLALGTDLDSTSCGPAAAASCLKYFADNGYPGLDNPGGDEAKPEQSGEDIARELQGAMGTNDSTGTSGAGMVAGIESYLDGHGAAGWDVSAHPVDSDADLAAMFREFEADSEDVIVLLQDTTTTGDGAGDTTGHWVTLGSREQIQHSADSTSQKIDFMNPWGGGSTADNNYDIGEDENGNPTTEGYDLDGAGGDAIIAGYIKVSPPEGGAVPGLRASRAPGAPAFDPDWIPVNAGIVRGNGLIDTLHWDTHGFMPGLYLMEVITTNHQGHTCRDIRLALLTEPGTGSDPGTPGMKTGLHGTYPNPFNPATNIVFSLEKDGPVTLVVYDIAGRRVRTLMNAKMTEAGSYTVAWDGVDDRGGRVSSGVYFCRFSSGETDSSTKMILLR